MTWILTGIFLAGSLIQDVRCKRISYIWLLANLPVAVFISLYESMDFLSLLLGLIPGTLLLFISFLSRERVGRGDALIVLVVGVYLGVSSCFFVLILGLLLSAVFGTIFVLARHMSMKRDIIFTPFLCAAYIVCLVLEYVGSVS